MHIRTKIEIVVFAEALFLNFCIIYCKTKDKQTIKQLRALFSELINIKILKVYVHTTLYRNAK